MRRPLFGPNGKNTKNGQSLINFKVKKSKLLSIDSATGKGRLIFKVECAVALAKATNPNAECAGIRLRDLEYVLVNDTVNGASCPTDASACAAYFSSAGLSATTQEFIQPRSDGLVNGGFTTKIDPTLALITPGKINVAPNMLFCLIVPRSVYG
ncbi:MAG: hypothetical protein H7249_02615 [Chitinophagaceae bacterium]|nr:hypothetical protein [Oligoflexus sp.]